MKIGVIGLGYRLGYLAQIAVETVPEARLVGHVDPSPYGLPRLAAAGIDPGPAYDSPRLLPPSGSTC